MPCWPDVWSRLVLFRWLAAPLLIIVVIVFMLWAPKIKWLWLRVASRIVGGAAALFVLAVIGLALLLSSGNPKPQFRVSESPTGRHKATLTYQAGFLGRDSSLVTVVSKGCCQHFRAYEYAGPSDINSTKMIWLDDSHLEIQYYLDPRRYQHCEKSIPSVTIICSPKPSPYAAN